MPGEGGALECNANCEYFNHLKLVYITCGLNILMNVSTSFVEDCGTLRMPF